MRSGDPAREASPASRLEPLTRLATGGMAEIWLARERGAAGLERFVVVKRLLPHLARDEEIVDMFVSEARFVARLVHPNVVQIHELGEDEDGYFLVMEYVEGCTVRELSGAVRRARRKLPAEVATSIIDQACRGAHAAHELTDGEGQPLGLVHRDISPHNLIVGPGGNVKLLDFGIAKATAAAEATHTGSLKGKSGYMSPEQCRAQPLDRRSDIFALGIVAWELFAGKRLYRRQSEYSSMDAIVSEDAPLVTEARPELPGALAEVVDKALRRNRDERWQTADEMRRALRRAAAQDGLRPSRDALVTTMSELLGPRLEERQEALRQAARQPQDPAALRNALMGVRPSQPSRSHSGTLTSDDIATVVHRRPSGAPSSGKGMPEVTKRIAAPDREAAGGPPSAPPSLLPDIPPLPPVPISSPLSEPTIDPAVQRAAQASQQDEPADSSQPAVSSQRPDRVPAQRAMQPSMPWEPTEGEEAPWPSVQPAPASRWSRWLALVLGVALVVVVVLWLSGRGEQSTAASQPAPSASASGTASVTVSAPVLKGPPLRFAVAPTVEPQVIRDELAPFVNWLARRLGRPIEVVISDSYEHCGEMLASNKADLGMLPPLLFVRTMAEHPDLQPVTLRLYDGARGSDGYLLVRDDAGISSPKELRERSVCLVDKTSTTGFLLPRIWMRKVGLDPEQDVTTVISGDHQQVLRDMLEKRCDAGAVYSGAYLSAQQQGIKVSRIRMLAITGHVPQDVFVAAANMPAELHKKVVELMLSFEPQRDIGAPRIGDVLGISGFAKYAPADFEPIRQAAEQEGLVPHR